MELALLEQDGTPEYFQSLRSDGRSLPARESRIERGLSSCTGLSKPLGSKSSVTNRTFQLDDSWLLQLLGI